MSSTEADPQEAEGWGIDWRKMRTWLEFAGIMLQLCLVGAMTSAFSVGAAVQIWPDGHWKPTVSAMFATTILLWILFRGWAFRLTVRDGELGNGGYESLMESASKTDKTAHLIWLLTIPAVILLHMGLVELFEIEARPWLYAVGMMPAMLIIGHGFPYVVERLRQSAAKRPTSES